MRFWNRGVFALLTITLGTIGTTAQAESCEPGQDAAETVVAITAKTAAFSGSPTFPELLERNTVLIAHGTCTDGQTSWPLDVVIAHRETRPTKWKRPDLDAYLYIRGDTTIPFRNPTEFKGVGSGSAGLITLIGDDSPGAWVNRGTFGNQTEPGATTDVRINFHDGSGTADIRLQYETPRKARCFGTVFPHWRGLHFDESGNPIEAVSETGDRLLYTYNADGQVVRMVRQTEDGNSVMQYQWDGDYPYLHVKEVICPDGRTLRGFQRDQCGF